MSTAREVYNFYWQHLFELPEYERFHFVTRLRLIPQDPKAQAYLQELKTELQVLDQAQQWQFMCNVLTNHTNTHLIQQDPERQAALTQYPDIRHHVRSILAHRNGQILFNQNFDLQIEEQKNDWIAMYHQLLQDTTALRYLSTFAINFLYLVHHYTQSTDTQQLTEQLYAVAQDTYNLELMYDLEKFLYFLTHILIADSLFYTKHLPPHSSILQRIGDTLNTIADNRYDDLHLDIKCEILVSNLLLQRNNKNLKEQVCVEASKSLSPKGNYLIDVVNNYPQTHRADLVTSEHRNVLYLCAMYDTL